MPFSGGPRGLCSGFWLSVSLPPVSLFPCVSVFLGSCFPAPGRLCFCFPVSLCLCVSGFWFPCIWVLVSLFLGSGFPVSGFWFSCFWVLVSLFLVSGFWFPCFPVSLFLGSGFPVSGFWFPCFWVLVSLFPGSGFLGSGFWFPCFWFLGSGFPVSLFPCFWVLVSLFLVSGFWIPEFCVLVSLFLGFWVSGFWVPEFCVDAVLAVQRSPGHLIRSRLWVVSRAASNCKASWCLSSSSLCVCTCWAVCVCEICSVGASFPSEVWAPKHAFVLPCALPLLSKG